MQSESIRIWNDLQDAETLNSPIHEDTITQTFALHLNRQHGRRCRVHIFSRSDEAINGSDFLWLFVSPNLARCFVVAVQAERLYPNGLYRAYRSAQVSAILSFSRTKNAFPIFIFYNFFPFGIGFYKHRGLIHAAFTQPPLFVVDQPRDFGVMFVPATLLATHTGDTLSPHDIAGHVAPLWRPLCTCRATGPSDALDQLTSEFSRDTKDASTDKGVMETPEAVRRWMEGQPLYGEELDDLLLPSGGESLDFKPSWLVCTRLNAGRVAE